jgi:hypothetical protein
VTDKEKALLKSHADGVATGTSLAGRSSDTTVTGSQGRTLLGSPRESHAGPVLGRAPFWRIQRSEVKVIAWLAPEP